VLQNGAFVCANPLVDYTSSLVKSSFLLPECNLVLKLLEIGRSTNENEELEEKKLEEKDEDRSWRKLKKLGSWRKLKKLGS
jgi:hypothetical protein